MILARKDVAQAADDTRQGLIDQAKLKKPCAVFIALHTLLPAQVKSQQKASSGFQKTWHAYCDAHGDGVYDPARLGHSKC